MPQKKIPNIRALSAGLKAGAMLLILLALNACASLNAPLQQAEYTDYGFHVVMRDVRHVVCRYGPYADKYTGASSSLREVHGGGVSLISGTVFKNLTCSWQALDGTLRSESVDMTQVLIPKVVRWDFTDVEVVTEDPIVDSPEVQIELRDKTFRIVLITKIRYWGEPYGGGRRTPYREVSNVLLERL